MEKILMIVKLIPALIELMKALEEAIPGQGKGEAKLAAAREILETTDKSIAAIWPSVAGVISVLVKTFNTAGIWSAK